MGTFRNFSMLFLFQRQIRCHTIVSLVVVVATQDNATSDYVYQQLPDNANQLLIFGVMIGLMVMAVLVTAVVGVWLYRQYVCRM